MIITIEIYYHYYITIVRLTECAMLVHSKPLHIIKKVKEEKLMKHGRHHFYEFLG